MNTFMIKIDSESKTPIDLFRHRSSVATSVCYINPLFQFCLFT